jgi:hypothetical protein
MTSLIKYYVSKSEKKKVIPEKSSYKKWTDEELIFLDDLMRVKTDLDYTKVTYSINKKFNKNRSIASVKNACKKRLQHVFKNANMLQGVEFYHISHFKNKYMIPSPKLQQILEINNIRVYKRENYKMISYEDMDLAEEIIKEYKFKHGIIRNKKTDPDLYSSKQVAEMLGWSFEYINKLVQQGKLTCTTGDGKYNLFSKKDIELYQQKQENLDKYYYTSWQLANLLNLTHYHSLRFARQKNMTIIKEGKYFYILKSSADPYIQFYNKIDVDYMPFKEACRRLERTQNRIAVICKENNIHIPVIHKVRWFPTKELENVKNIIKECREKWKSNLIQNSRASKCK